MKLLDDNLKCFKEIGSISSIYEKKTFVKLRMVRQLKKQQRIREKGVNLPGFFQKILPPRSPTPSFSLTRSCRKKYLLSNKVISKVSLKILEVNIHV